jgi:predicted DCC family thiol-disulfide oxidoreductase YuxK
MNLGLKNEVVPGRLTVFYDGACPLCRREIKFYKGIDGSHKIKWQNIAIGKECNSPEGLSREAALKRFHIESLNGQLLDGAVAFEHVGRSLPRFYALGWIAQLSPVTQILDLAYVLFLKFRPTIQKFLR